MEIRRYSRTHVVGSLVLCWLAALPLVAAEKSPQKVFGEVKPDQALVYLIREGHMLAAAVTVFVYADQQFIGTLSSNSYTFSYLTPGTHLLWAHPLGFTVSNTRVELEAGKVYYFNVWNTFDPLDEVTGPAFLKGIKAYVTPEQKEREKANEQIEKEYARQTAKAVNDLESAPQVDNVSRRQEHVAAWPKVDLKPFAILCIEDFVMADPEAGSRKQDYLVESVPLRLAKFVVADLGPGVFEEVRQSPACEAAPGVAVLRASIMKYKPGSETARAIIAGAGSAQLRVHVTLANGETGNALSQFDAKGLWAWGGQLGASRGIQDLEKNVAYEMASYLKYSKGVAEPPEVTKK
jgi:hypothetical protein